MKQSLPMQYGHEQFAIASLVPRFAMTKVAGTKKSRAMQGGYAQFAIASLVPRFEMTKSYIT